MKALVTGATGFTGGHLAKRLEGEGYEVRAVVLRSEINSQPSLTESSVEVVEGDLKDIDSLRRATQDVDVVFHIAALYREAGLPDSEYWEVNAKGTERLLQASRENGVKRFVHCSTVGVLGSIKNPPADETCPYAPGDVYQRSKLAGELAAIHYGDEYGFPVSIVRPAAIYGEGDDRFLKLFRMISRKRAIMLGDGKTLYHLVHVDDLVTGFLLASQVDEAVHETFIIAGEKHVTLQELFRMIADSLGVPLKQINLPVGPVNVVAALVEKTFPVFGIEPPIYRRRVHFYTKHRAFDISKAKRILGYKPAVSLEEGIERTKRWYREQKLL
jgi:nucleoside-diphosphate-sugar epimerase